MDKIIEINSAVNGFVWGPIMLALLVGTGIYLSFRVGFIQFSKIGYWWKNTIGKIFQKSEAGEGEITPMQAVSTALASTVGTGNIAGVTGAIILGGPGAVFWMWISALFGMVTKFAEVTLAVKYRERNEKGDWCGGPMYYIKNGLGPKWKWLGVIFSVFGALAAFGIGNISQINSIASSVNSVAVAFHENAKEFDTIIGLITGVVIAIFVALVLLGGVKRIGQVTEKLVPGMAAIYIVCALVVVIANAGTIPGVFASIFQGAFNPSAVVGGAVGVTMKLAITKGVGRGVFSNEAGLGSAPIAHAATSEKNPVRQGLYGIFEVFMDTIVICTLTSLVVLCSGAATGNYGNNDLAGVPTAVAGFASVFGDKLGSLILAVGLLLFATSTILGWALYGTRCAEFLFGSKIIRPYQVLFCLVVIAGSAADLKLVWDISDTLNGLMAIPNLIADKFVFTGCTFTQPVSQVGYGCKEVLFDNCKFNTNGYGIKIYSEGSTPVNLTVKNSAFKNTGSAAKSAIFLDHIIDGISYSINVEKCTFEGFTSEPTPNENSYATRVIVSDSFVKSGDQYVFSYQTGEEGGSYHKILTAQQLVVKIDGKDQVTAKVDTYQALKDAIGFLGKTDLTLDITANVTVPEGEPWTPISVDGSQGNGTLTINGNGHKIVGLNAPLVANTWAGKSNCIIKGLTLENANIVVDENDANGNVGVGAFIGQPCASQIITLENCNLVNSTVKGGHWAGGLIGVSGGYNGTDGPVFENVTIKNCSVTGSTIESKGSVGAIIGHAAWDSATRVDITGCTVTGNTVKSTGSSNDKAGSLMGTVGCAGSNQVNSDLEPMPSQACL